MGSGAAVAAVTATLLGCGLAGDGPAGDGSAGNGSAGDRAEAAAPRRICDGSSEIRLAIGYGGGGNVISFTSVLYEVGIDFLYVDGTCHYWAQQPISIVDEYYAWRPYREGVLSSEQERQLYDSVGYDNVTTSSCASRPVVTDGGGGPFLWDGREFHPCFDWTATANDALRTDLFDAATAVTGPMRIQVGRQSIGPNTPVYEWPLDAPIEQYVIADGETRSFRIDDAAAVTALRAFRMQGIADAEVAPGFFAGAIAIGPREGDASYVMSLRDELPFVGAQGSWLPATAIPTTTDTEATSSSDVGEGSPTQAQCDQWSSRASIARRAAQDAAGRSCSSDTDCTIASFGPSCWADCGYPSAVARAAVPALEAEVQSLDRHNCAPFEERGCPQPIPLPCTPPSGEPVAVCSGGQCVLELVPHP
jgi:hypothetical protein